MPESAAAELIGPDATVAAGRRLGAALARQRPTALVIYLEGTLGAGKTTFARGVLAGLGHQGRVPSPTYTLIEPYEVSVARVVHIDLYRVRDPRELDDLALAELLGPGTYALIEWPDHGVGHLPPPDLVVRLALSPQGRRIHFVAASPVAQPLTGCLSEAC
jgi:tRNA threonylcarbamoyladenosine biosynthesis protein TsaE